MNYEELIMYRDTKIIFSHYFGWQYFFKFDEYFYYAFYSELEQAKEGAIRQVDNLYMKKELNDE